MKRANAHDSNNTINIVAIFIITAGTVTKISVF